MATEKSRNWLFQGNPKRYDLASEIEKGRTEENWAVTTRRLEISPGDRVFFWQTGPEARLLAVGHVASPVHERTDNEFGRFSVDLAFDYKIVPPLTKDEIKKNDTLWKFQPFKGQQGTNFSDGPHDRR